MHPGQSPCNGGFRVVSDLVLVGSCFSQRDLFLGLLFGNKLGDVLGIKRSQGFLGFSNHNMCCW